MALKRYINVSGKEQYVELDGGYLRVVPLEKVETNDKREQAYLERLPSFAIDEEPKTKLAPVLG